LYVKRGNRLVLCVWVDRGWVDFNLVSFVVQLSRGDAMVEFVPLTVAPCYCCWWVCYLPTEVVIPPLVPWVGCVDMQKLGVGLV